MSELNEINYTILCKIASNLLPIFWRQQISWRWSYCIASRTFGLLPWCNSNKAVAIGMPVDLEIW